MRQALRLTAVVAEDGRLNVEAPDLTAGERVDVIVLREDPNSPAKPKKTVAEFLAGRPQRGVFSSAAEIDAYIREERASWGDEDLER
jgi:hypothetical protein